MVEAGAAAIPPNRNWAARVLPVSEQQSCVACGSQDWAWLFPLDPETGRGFTFGYFVCACDGHRADLDSDDAERAAAALAYIADGDLDAGRDYAAAFLAGRLGPPLSRSVATRG